MICKFLIVVASTKLSCENDFFLNICNEPVLLQNSTDDAAQNSNWKKQKHYEITPIQIY